MKASKDEFKRHLTEAFFNGLGKYTKNEMIKQASMCNLAEVLRYLTNLG